MIRLLAAVGLMIITYFGAVMMLKSRQPSEVDARPLASSVRNDPPSAPAPRPQVTEPSRPRERIYRDGKGNLISEREGEEKMQTLRDQIAAMPDNAKRAYMQGVMKALEEEWARIKSQGPVN
jgi:hypothetical protein